MLNCFYDCYRILNKIYSEKTFIKQALNGVDIEEKNRALTTKIVYGVLDKDIELSYYLDRLVTKNPKLVIRTILKISMYCIKYLNKKEYAVIDNAVELTKKLGKGGTSGFVNAVLRKFDKTYTNIELPKKENEFLSIKYSFPLFAVDELLKTYSFNRVESILSAPLPNTTVVFYDTNGEEYLKNKGLEYCITPFKNVYSVKNFVRNNDFDKGIYTFQALGSVAICEVFDSGNSLLDCCSAPGGKSIRLSYKFDSITSFDVHSHRVDLINEYKTRMKRENITASVVDMTVFNSEFVDKFDAVLVDAPCSGLGVTNDNPDIKLNREKENIDELNKIQKKILKNASKYVKVGGQLVYSTCSILNRENIEIVRDFICNNDGFIIDKIDSKLKHEDIEGTNAFLPDISGGLGFYVAKLKRVK